MKGTSDPRDVLAIVRPASIAAASLVAQHVAGKAVRDTLFLTHFGLDLLPAAMLGGALISAVSVIGISRALRMWGPTRVVPAMFALSALLHFLEWALTFTNARATAAAVYVHTALFGSAIVSAFWSLVSERFDPHTAKKVVGRIASGGTAGGVLGGLIVWRGAAHVSVPVMLAVLAAINGVGLWGSLRTARGATTKAAPPEPLEVAGWKVLRTTSYLRDLALLVVAAAVIQALLDWLLSAHASRSYGKGPELLAFFALFNMVVGLVSFAAQSALSRPLLEWRGLAGTIKSLPLVVAAFAVVGLLSPHLWPVIFVRGAEAVTRNSVFRSAYELFYTPLATARKRSTKTIIDVGADRVGTTLGSIALLAIVHLGADLATRAVLVATLVAAALAWMLATRLHDGYVSALATSLRSGAVALDVGDVIDRTTKQTLADSCQQLDREKLLEQIALFEARPEAELTPLPDHRAAPDPITMSVASLRSGDVTRIKAALHSPLSAAAASFAISLLANDAVARDAVRALRKIAPRVTGQLVDALLDRELDVRARRRIPRVLKVCQTQRAAAGLLLALEDPAFEVRAEVAVALAALRVEASLVLPPEPVLDAAIHELTVGRSSWRDQNVQRGLAHTFTLLGLVLDREPLAIAHRALRSNDPALRGTAFEYVEVVVPPRIRTLLMPLLGDANVPKSAGERGPKELADELLRSNPSLARDALTDA